MKVTLLVTGSVAAYKAADVAAQLRRSGAEVHAALSHAAAQFVTPLTLEAVTGHRVIVDFYAGGDDAEVHLSLANADALAVVPASANAIARLALGLADDVIGSVFLAWQKGSAVIAPAMATALWRNKVTQRHVETLGSLGHVFVGPVSGPLASGEVGEGRMADPAQIVRAIMSGTGRDRKDLTDVKVLVTAGPTREAWDAVRFLSSRSSGRMGFAVAARAAARGARVVLVHGPVGLAVPYGVKAVPVTTADEMAERTLAEVADVEVLVGAAAVADYRPAQPLTGKFRKGPDRIELALVRNRDILAEAAALPGRKRRVHVGFAAEVGDPVPSGRTKLEAKHLDLVVANDVTAPGAGFEVETNRVTLIFREWGTDGAIRVDELPLMAKTEVADRVLDQAAAVLAKRRELTET